MGLDVSFYINLKFVNDIDNLEIDECIKVWAYEEFKDHYAPLKEGYYKADCVSGFYAGSYGGYGMFRRELCLKFFGINIEKIWLNPEKYKKLPFYYLLNFADNEGVIAGYPFKKLQQDFKDLNNPFEYDLRDDWMKKKYDEWKEHILKSECVVFH